MELETVEIPMRGNRGEQAAVLAAGHRIAAQRRGKAMDEIRVAVGIDARQQRRLA